MNFMSHITLPQRQMDFAKAANCKFTASQILELMILFPFFAIKNSLSFAGSVLGQMFACKEDMFYRFLSNEDINWRQIVYGFNRRLLSRIAMRSDSVNGTDTRCLISDDADFPKTGRKGELLGRIFSHIKHASILGYKGLFLLFTDGKTQTFVGFTLQGEMGKRPAKPQGMTQKQLDARYGKELVKFVRSRHIGCHLLGMTKMSKEKYDTTEGAMTANAIMARESKRKGPVKYSRHYRFYYCGAAATFAGTPVKLFFYRNGKKGEWNALLSTNTALGAYEAYKIYSMRWAIEVSFAEAKRLLNLGKCQCRDFASQIASISLCMLQYNILGYVTRYESYETIGGVFRGVTQASVELTVTEKNWDILIDVLQTIAEAFHFDQDEGMRAIINNNNKEFNAVRRAFEALQQAA